MNTASTLPEYLPESQRTAICEVIDGLEFLPLSCLFHSGDEHRVIRSDRVICDDFLYIPVNGSLDCIVNDEKRVISAGEFMMVPAGDRHGVVMAEGVEKYDVFALHMHLYDTTRHRFLRKMQFRFGSIGCMDEWTARLSTCVALMGSNPATGGAYMRQVVKELLIMQLLRGCALRQLPVQLDPRISPLLMRIRVQPESEWTVSEMARHCNLSVSRFRQLFVHCIGTSPQKYLRKVRLSLARSLLMTEPLLTVEEVAERVGISDAHYFHAIYKKQFGETPKHKPAL